MKVLIVDDEAHVIRAVKLLVPWEELGITEIYEALAPQEAIRIIETEHPEILITDIVMQDLSGIDLMKYITNSPEHIKVIVISGYNNFDYVRSSLQHGGVDYLLKPLDQGQLIAAVQKAVDAWNQEHTLYHTARINRSQIDSMATLCRENLLSKLIHGDHSGDAYEKLTEISPELLKLSSCGFAYCSLEPFISQEDDSWRRAVRLFRDSLSEFLTGLDGGFLLPAEKTHDITVFLSDPSDPFLECLKEFLAESQKALLFPACMGIAAGRFPEDIVETFQKARAAFSACNMTTFTPLLCRADSSVSAPANRLTDSQKAVDDRMLLSALLTGNDTLIHDSTALWITNRIPENSPLLSVVSAAVQEENQLFANWVELFTSRHQGFFHQPDYQVLRYRDVLDETMRFSFSRFEKRMEKDMLFLYQELKSIHSPEADMIYQVAHYIELNFSQPFSQHDCARMFFVNQEYLCRKFKQTFHVTMITYLNNIRIEHARQMLKDPLIKIRQIAHEVGFEDEKYFSRQFKKSTGMTPGDYRLLYMEQVREG